MSCKLRFRLGNSLLCLLGLILLWAMSPQMLIQAQYQIPQEGMRDAAWSPDGTQLATANPDGAVRIWNQSGHLLQTFAGHEDKATVVTWSPDGSLLVSGGTDTFVRVWDIKTGRLIREFNPFLEGGIVALAWQPSGKYLLVAGFSNLQAWDTSTWLPLLDDMGVSVWDLKWHPDGSRFTYANGDVIRAGTIENGQFTVVAYKLVVSSEIIEAVDWSSDGKKLVSAGGRDGSVRLWDTQTGQQLELLLQTQEFVNDVAFTTSLSTQVVATTQEGHIYTVDVVTKEVRQTLSRQTYLWGLAWNPEANLLAIVGWNKDVQETSRVQKTGEIDSSTAFAPNGFLEIISLGENK